GRRGQGVGHSRQGVATPHAEPGFWRQATLALRAHSAQSCATVQTKIGLGQMRTTARWAVHGVPSCNAVVRDEGLEDNWLVLTTTILMAAYTEHREASS